MVTREVQTDKDDKQRDTNKIDTNRAIQTNKETQTSKDNNNQRKCKCSK